MIWFEVNKHDLQGRLEICVSLETQEIDPARFCIRVLRVVAGRSHQVKQVTGLLVAVPPPKLFIEWLLEDIITAIGANSRWRHLAKVDENDVYRWGKGNDHEFILPVISEEYCDVCETSIKTQTRITACPNCGVPVVACNACKKHMECEKCSECSMGSDWETLVEQSSWDEFKKEFMSLDKVFDKNGFYKGEV